MTEVSVIVPTFERPALAERAIVSVLRQTHAPGEVIVVDDGSPSDYGARLASLDPSIRVVRLDRNHGPAGARNAGLAIASGDVVCFLDDDDEYHSTYVARVTDALAASPEDVGLCWTGVLLKRNGAAGDRVRDYAGAIHDRRSLLESFLAIGLGHGIAVKRRCFTDVGAFSDDLRLAEDTEWFLRFLARGYLPTVVPGVEVTVHCHDGERLTDVDRDVARRRECGVVLDRMASFLDGYPYLRAMLVNAVGLSGRA